MRQVHVISLRKPPPYLSDVTLARVRSDASRTLPDTGVSLFALKVR